MKLTPKQAVKKEIAAWPAWKKKLAADILGIALCYCTDGTEASLFSVECGCCDAPVGKPCKHKKGKKR